MPHRSGDIGSRTPAPRLWPLSPRGRAVDRRTNIAYLTEDQSDSCLYRFVPTRRDEPFVGKLQALRAVGAANYDTSERMAADHSIGVDWVDVREADPKEDIVREQAREAGALRVCRGEGIAYHDGAVIFTATSGGLAGKVHFPPSSRPAGNRHVGHRVRAQSQLRLELLAEGSDATLIDAPDNVTVTPWGDVFFAEDGSGDQYIRAIGADGRVRDIARNAKSASELSGVCFSPDGSTLFFNMQRDGLTVAVRGPFIRGV